MHIRCLCVVIILHTVYYIIIQRILTWIGIEVSGVVVVAVVIVFVVGTKREVNNNKWSDGVVVADVA